MIKGMDVGNACFFEYVLTTKKIVPKFYPASKGTAFGLIGGIQFDEK